MDQYHKIISGLQNHRELAYLNYQIYVIYVLFRSVNHMYNTISFKLSPHLAVNIFNITFSHALICRYNENTLSVSFAKDNLRLRMIRVNDYLYF